MAWVLSAVLLGALVAAVVILRRQVTTLRRELAAAPDRQGGRAETRGPTPVTPVAAVEAPPVVVNDLSGAIAAAAGTMASTSAAPPATAAAAAAAPPVEPPASADPSAGPVAEDAEAARPDGALGAEPVHPPLATVAPASPDAQRDGRLPSLWALTLLEQRRQWQLSVAGGAALNEEAPDSLPGALAIEIERIREEVGTPGSLDVEAAAPMTADDAALLFHATRQLLALLVPHTQAFDLVLHRTDDHAEVELTCSGWEGPDQVADGIGRLLEAVAPAGGDLELDMLPGDRLQARLRLPLH